MIFILNLSRKRNLERTLFVHIHSLIKYKFQQTPIEPGLPVYVFVLLLSHRKYNVYAKNESILKKHHNYKITKPFVVFNILLQNKSLLQRL